MLCFMSRAVCDGTVFTECVLEDAVHVQEAVVALVLGEGHVIG